jgi:hypothetical protein
MFKKMGMTLVVVGAITLAGCVEASSSIPTSSSEASSSVAVDPALAKLQSAYDSLGGLIADPTNITTGFQVPVNLANGVTATWTSAEPGVLGFSTTPVNGLINATVNRPAKDNGDASFNVFADLSIAAELTAGNLTRRWTQGVTVKQNTVELIVINSIADILALRDPSLDRTLNVTLANLTIFARSGGEAFAYDGTGIIQIYRGAAENLTVGRVYTISGLIDWYYGIWEIVDSTAEEQVNATPQTPTKEAITGVLGEVNRLTGEGAQLSAGLTAEAGNFEPIFARVTGKVAIIADRPANYNTYILDKDMEPAAFVAGAGTVPANALLVYYQTVDYNLIKAFDGIEITIDVVIFTFRSDQRAFAVYYVGGPTGVNANLTDEQSQAIDAAALSLPASITEATTLTLPATGTNGLSAITWSSSHPEVINVTTGVVTIPNPAVGVTLTATVSKGTATPAIRTFVINVGAPQAINLSTLETLAFGSVAKTDVKVVWKNPSTSPSLLNRAFIVADATGYAYLVNDVALPDLKVNDFVSMTYEVAQFNGYTQMTKVRITAASGTAPTSLPSPTVWTSTEAKSYLALSRFGIRYVTINDLIGFKSGNFLNAYLPGFGSTNTVRTDGAPATLENLKFNATGFIIGRGSSFITFNNDASNYSTGVAATDAEKLAIAVERFVPPTPNNEVTGNITLPSITAFGSVAWTSDSPSVISNTGAVTRPESGQPDATVKLSYVLTVGSNSTLPIEITYVVKAAEAIPVVTLFTNDFGTVTKTGYAAGNIVYTPTGGTEITALKDRVQINLSASAPHTSKGVFAVFAPISTFKVSFLDVDFSTLTGAGKLELEYSVWSAAALGNLKNTALITSAQLKLQKFDGTNWIDEGSALNVITNASDTEYKKTSFSLSGAAKYRLVYTIEGTANTSNTAFALTVDNLVVTDK